MVAERFVVLGLAHVRSAWFGEVSHWSTSAVLPLEFLKAMSVDEVRVRLRSGRKYSALLVDDSVPGLDRDLVDLALAQGCAVILVGDGRRPRGGELAASGQLTVPFDQDDLLGLLAVVSAPLSPVSVEATDLVHSEPSPASTADVGFRGHLVAVTGAGGTGRSTVAMALAQGLAADPRHTGLVCVADFALHADMALLHDALDVIPGVLELVEAHRGGTPSIESVRALTWHVDARGYHLLLGLRRHRDWTSIRPRALDAAIDSLRRCFRAVVADVDDDLEGEGETGSLDVEERNAISRSVTASASLVVVVGTPGMHGVHGMLRVTRDLLDHGVSGGRILPVVNHAPRSPRVRAELARAFGDLLAGGARPNSGVPSPIHLSTRRHLEATLQDGGRLPDQWLTPICSPVLTLLNAVDDLEAPPHQALEPVAVLAGSLGRWTDQHEDPRRPG